MFLIRPYKRKHFQKMKVGNAEEILKRLEDYLKDNESDPIQILCGFWKDQQAAITYQELREAVIAGALTKETFNLWSKDYSVLVQNKLRYVWEDAMKAGSVSQPVLSALEGFTFDLSKQNVINWIQNHGAEFVTVVTQEQKGAISALLARSVREKHSVDELAKFIRPCIGLTEPQAKANLRYYENMVANLKEQHPRMKTESVQKKAREAAAKYAEKQHQYRAMTIAQTEMATAYNRGADEAIRQAQAQKLMGTVIKRWCTSGDDMVCDQCRALEGLELAMDDKFQMGSGWNTGENLTPPAHPRCACVVEYIETETPTYTNENLPEMKVSITQENSLKEYSTEEIENIAAQTEEIASKHISTPSKWSGNIIVDDEKNITGKLWSCDILVTHETSPHMILHEQIHARSISYFEEKDYILYQIIEEASVQLMAQEISIKEGIEIIESDYDEIVNALREIGRYIGLFDTDYEFAKTIIEKNVPERLNWLSDKLYAKLGKDINITREEYKKWADSLDMLYVKG